MVAIPRDGVVSPWWVRLRLSCLTRSRATLDLGLAGERFLGGLRPPLSRRLAFERLCDSRNMLGSISTAAASDVDQPSPRKIPQITRHVLRPQVEAGFRQRIRQTGVGVTRDRHLRLFRQLLQKRIHQIGAERAVEAHRQRLYM